MSFLLFAAAVCLFAPLMYAAYSDFRFMVIPNLVSIVIVAAFILFALAKWPAIDLKMHAVIGAAYFGSALVLWIAGWLGGGDVKLLGATGLWLGVGYAVPFLFILSVVAPILAAALMIMRRLTQPPKDNTPFIRRRILDMAHSGRIAYGIPIAIAGLATLPRVFL